MGVYNLTAEITIASYVAIATHRLLACNFKLQEDVRMHMHSLLYGYLMHLSI